MSRVYNFSAGPSMLPEEVLRKAADEMLDYEGCGQSVMEMSHRSKEYEGIIRSAESLLRELMNIPEIIRCFFTGRRVYSVCCNPAQFDEWQRQGGLCCHRPVGK